MRWRGAVIGFILGVTAVAAHGAIEGFQDGFARDGSPWAPAGTMKAAGDTATFDLLHPSALTLTFLLGSVFLGASAAPMIRAPHPPGETDGNGAATLPARNGAAKQTAGRSSGPAHPIPQ